MVSPRWRKVLRDLWVHRARSVLVILAIAAGLAGAGTVLNTWALVERATRESFLASQPASATLRVDSVDARVLALVREDPDVAVAEGRRTVSASILAQGTWRTAQLFAADDLAQVQVGRLELERGAWPLGDGSFTLEQSSVTFSGLSVGEPVTLAVGDGPQVQLAVAGVARDVGLAPGWMEHIVYGFVAPATLARLGVPSALDQVRLVVRDRSMSQAEVRRVAYRVKAALEAAGRAVHDVDVPEPGRHIHADQMNSLLLTQGAFGGLALALSGFLVVNLIVAILTRETRLIGVMKTIGARPEQLAGMYLGYALGLGVIATGIAAPIAVVAGRAYGAFKAELLNFEVTGYAIPLFAIVLQVLVGCLLPVVAALGPVWQACRRGSAEAIRDVGIGAVDGSAPWTHRVTGLSRPMLLSLRNAFRRRGRMALTLVTLALGGAVFLGAVNLRQAIRASVDVLFQRQAFDLLLRFDRAVPADSVESLVGSVAGVTRVEAWRAVRGAVATTDGALGNSFPITGVRLPSALLRFVAIEGRWLMEDDDRAIVANRTLAKSDPIWRVGARVPVVVAGRTDTMTVVGVVESSFGAAAYVPLSGPLAGPILATSAAVATDLQGPALELDLIQRARTALGEAGVAVASSQRLAENRRVVEDHLLTVADFLGVMGWLLLAVGGMGLASTMSLGVLERTREIGVLKAIGARHGAIARLVEVEGLVVGLASWLLALPLSVPMSVALARAFSRTMLEVPASYLPNGSGVLWWLLLVVVVSLSASAWPAYRAMRVPTRVALAYE